MPTRDKDCTDSGERQSPDRADSQRGECGPPISGRRALHEIGNRAAQYLRHKTLRAEQSDKGMDQRRQDGGKYHGIEPPIVVRALTQPGEKRAEVNEIDSCQPVHASDNQRQRGAKRKEKNQRDGQIQRTVEERLAAQAKPHAGQRSGVRDHVKERVDKGQDAEEKEDGADL